MFIELDLLMSWHIHSVLTEQKVQKKAADA